jgi:disease resistance protein RPM1
VLDRLGEFSLLRVLDLEDCMGMEDKHLIHVCRMYLLRFLGLKGTAISKMPPEVGKLENLETLDVRETYFEEGLPDTVTKLEKLEHLRNSHKHNGNCWIARPGLGSMKALRTLNEVKFGCDVAAAEELGELIQLRELRITLDTSDQDVSQKLAKSMSKIYSLRWLNVSSTSRDRNVLNFLHELKPPPRLLQYLRIGAGINKMPEWVGSLNYLTEIYVAWTYLVGDQLFHPLCKLPNLWRIHLEAYYFVDPELVAQAHHTFPALKELYLNFDIEGMEVLRFQEESMSKLERLQVRFLHRDTKKVFGIEHLTSIKEVILEGKKENPALHRAVEQLKTLNGNRPESDQIKVAVRYE